MCNNNKDVLEEFLQRMEETLSSNTIHKEIAKMEKEIQGLENKKNKLVDMRLRMLSTKIRMKINIIHSCKKLMRRCKREKSRYQTWKMKRILKNAYWPSKKYWNKMK